LARNTLTDQYNAGFGLDAVVVVEGSDLDQPSVTLESVVSGHTILGITVDGAALCVRTGSAVDLSLCGVSSIHWFPFA
jgi:hypothetical protein